jgi:N-sulfoglucosamine sulfohydrolase
MYNGSVHRADETVGAVLRALDDSGLRDSTVVSFMSDHGMSFPFAKSNCYLHSTNVPWIVRWPGRTQAGAVNDAQFVSGIDFMPTILDLAGLPGPQGMDGISYRPLLEGRSQDGRDEVYTVFTSTSAGREYPMRCLQNRRFGYVFNAWADGKRTLKMESHQGPTYWAMRLAALKDPNVAARVELLRHRVPEELYDFEHDPGALANLVNDESHAATHHEMRAKMVAFMESVGDPLLPDLRRRMI